MATTKTGIYRTKDEKTVISSYEFLAVVCYILAVGLIIIIIYELVTIVITFGQDIDPRYVCLYSEQHPFNEMCFEQKLQEFMNKYYNWTLSK